MATLRAIRLRVACPPRVPITVRQPSPFVRPAPPQIYSSSLARRCYATEGASPVEAPDHLDERERKIFEIITQELQPTKLEVQDISGGCGSMYALDIVSAQFKGLPVIKQHRLVNKVLGEEIKQWHGVQLKTKAP